MRPKTKNTIPEYKFTFNTSPARNKQSARRINEINTKNKPITKLRLFNFLNMLEELKENNI
jgi:hypothetical protein